MTKKPENWYFQSAVIPFKTSKGKTEILLIRSRKDKKWIIPKGIIENSLPAAQSAVKEAYEEAGIQGNLLNDKMWNYKYSKWEGICQVKVYLLEVTEMLKTWPENFRKRRWFTIDKALEKISNKDLKLILRDKMANWQYRYVKR